MPFQEWPWCQGPEHRRDGCIHTSSSVAAVLPPTGSQARSSGAQPGQVLSGSSLEGMLEAAEPRLGGWPGTTGVGGGLEVCSWLRSDRPSRLTPDYWDAELQPLSRGDITE